MAMFKAMKCTQFSINLTVKFNCQVRDIYPIFCFKSKRDSNIIDIDIMNEKSLKLISKNLVLQN